MSYVVILIKNWLIQYGNKVEMLPIAPFQGSSYDIRGFEVCCKGCLQCVHTSIISGQLVKWIRKDKDIVSLKEYVENNTVDEKTFGSYLKSRMESLNMSLRGLASELKVSAAYISDIEKGNRYAPSQEKLVRLMEILQIPEDDQQAFSDLASATHGFSYGDINPYLGRQPHARVALRKAEKLGLSDSFWISVVEQMDQAEAEQLKALEEDRDLPD